MAVVTPDVLRRAVAAVLRTHGAPDDGGLVETLAAVADQHAAEEVAASHAGAST